MKHKGIKAAVFLVGIAVVAFSIGTALRLKRTVKERSDLEYLRLVPEVMGIIKQKYVEKVDDKKLVEGAITGMLSALDPHSAYLPPDFFKEMNIEISGTFGGLGIEITLADGRLMVIAPIDDTPAYRAGIKPGDIIWKINDRFTRDMNINEAVNRMRGQRGTEVTLTIIRKNLPRPLVLKIVRDTIRTQSVKAQILQPGYGYVRISHFQERTGEEFAAALQKLRRENGGNLRGLVIDLRNNPGGLLEPAVSVAGRFIDPKDNNGLIVFTRGREEASRLTLTSSLGEKEPPYPLVVLINGGSASASEIVAGALQDHKRGVILGTQSFGKGSVQTIFPLPGQAGLKLTTAKYYTPNGRSIQAKGITPDIVVDNGDTVVAPRKKEWVVREQDLDNHMKTDDETAAPAPAPAPAPESKALKDNQLDRALDLLQGLYLLKRDR